MSLVSILLFFLYMFGFGFSITYLFKAKEDEDFLEKNVMRLGFGLAVFVVLGVILNLLKVPLYWWIFLVLSQITVLYALYKKRASIKTWLEARSKFQLKKKHIFYVILLLLFAFNLYTYTTGSLSYGYLEDDDPWTYARDVKYVALEKTLDVPYYRGTNHLDPYPPAYVMTLGILHQTSADEQWTIKFFNSLLISLGVLFFFFMVRKLTQSLNIALASTFILSMLPSYLGHFIWSHSLAPGWFFLLIYSFEQLMESKSFLALSAVTYAAILLTHPIQAAIITVLAGIYFAGRWIYFKKFPWEIGLSVVLGVVISLAWWAFKFRKLLAMRLHDEAILQSSGTSTLASGISKALPTLYDPSGGSATRGYSFSDFFIATKNNMINQPIGWGIAISILLVITLVLLAVKYKSFLQRQNYWQAIAVGWFLFMFMDVNATTFGLPFGLNPFRAWALLAVSLSIITGYGLVQLANSFDKIKILKYGVIILLIAAIFFTSGYYKYYHNTNPGWPPGAKLSISEAQGLVWMKNNLPLDSTVFSFTEGSNRLVFGANMYACVWCDNYRNFKEQNLLEINMTEMHGWLRKNDISYIMFMAKDATAAKKTFYKDNETIDEQQAAQKYEQKLNEAVAMSNKFQPVHQEQGFILLKVI